MYLTYIRLLHQDHLDQRAKNLKSLFREIDRINVDSSMQSFSVLTSFSQNSIIDMARLKSECMEDLVDVLTDQYFRNKDNSSLDSSKELLDTSIKYVDQCIKIKKSDEVHDDEGLAQMYNDGAEILYEMLDFEKSKEYVKQAKQISEKIGCIHNLSRAYYLSFKCRVGMKELDHKHILNDWDSSMELSRGDIPQLYKNYIILCSQYKNEFFNKKIKETIPEIKILLAQDDRQLYLYQNLKKILSEIKSEQHDISEEIEGD